MNLLKIAAEHAYQCALDQRGTTFGGAGRAQVRQRFQGDRRTDRQQDGSPRAQFLRQLSATIQFGRGIGRIRGRVRAGRDEGDGETTGWFARLLETLGPIVSE